MSFESVVDGAVAALNISREDLGSLGFIMFGTLGWFGVFFDSKHVRFSKFVSAYCASAGAFITASVWDGSLLTESGMPSMGASAAFESLPYLIQLIQEFKKKP